MAPPSMQTIKVRVGMDDGDWFIETEQEVADLLAEGVYQDAQYHEMTHEISKNLYEAWVNAKTAYRRLSREIDMNYRIREGA